MFRATWKYIPYRLLEYVKYLPTQKFTRLRNTKNVIDKVASALVEQAIDEARRVGIEKGKKDVMSVLGMSGSLRRLCDVAHRSIP